MIIESVHNKRLLEEENRNTKMINSFFNIFRTPQPRPHILLKNRLLNKNKKKLMKDSQTNTDSALNNNKISNLRFSVNNNLLDILSLKNIIKPKQSIFISNLYNMNNDIITTKKHKNNNNSTRMPKINPNKFQFIKDTIKLDETFPLKKRIFSSKKRKFNKSLIFENINNINVTINRDLNKNIIKFVGMNNNKIIKRNNLEDIENSMNNYKKKVGKKLNNFFNNKFLQENTDIFKVSRNIINKNDVNLQFSEPKNSNSNNIIVDNNISLENTFKEQTLSNFNNKYYLKFKTNNLKEKEKIRKLFYLLKKHKDSENDKNSDFLAFHLYRQKKLRKKEINKAILDEFSSPCVHIGRNNDSIFINNEYYTTKSDNEYSLTHKQKENKMISIKALNINA